MYLLLLLVTATFACSGHVVFYLLQLTEKITVTPENLCKYFDLPREYRAPTYVIPIATAHIGNQ